MFRLCLSVVLLLAPTLATGQESPPGDASAGRAYDTDPRSERHIVQAGQLTVVQIRDLLSGYRSVVNVDIPGSDLRPGFAVSDPDECRTACIDNAGCVAWTYVNAGVQGPTPNCWIKSQIPDGYVGSCCTSGTVLR